MVTGLTWLGVAKFGWRGDANKVDVEGDNVSKGPAQTSVSGRANARGSVAFSLPTQISVSGRYGGNVSQWKR